MVSVTAVGGPLEALALARAPLRTALPNQLLPGRGAVVPEARLLAGLGRGRAVGELARLLGSEEARAAQVGAGCRAAFVCQCV
jgi:hypothetical protein